MQRMDKGSGGGMKSSRPAAHTALLLLLEALLPLNMAKRGAKDPVVLGRLILGPGGAARCSWQGSGGAQRVLSRV